MSLFHELRRRNVLRVGLAYAVSSWVLLQITDVITPILALPEWAPKLVFVILAVGLVPALIFAWAFELTPEGLKREKDVDRAESITPVTGRKLDYIIIAVLGVAVVLLLADRFSGTPGVPPAAANDKSIAVLPFVNMSSDPEQDYFSDGVTEEILNALAAVKELKVAGRTSSFAFKGQSEDLRRIGDALGVENILEGSVRKSGTKVRITAQLVQVEDGFHLWSETYDRELTDVFEIQDEIATEILKQLKAKLLNEEREVLVSQPTTPEVYELYLLAKQRMYNRTQPTIESAVALLDQAIAKDAAYAPAQAQRGIATLLLAEQNYGTIPDADAERLAKRFLDTALEQDPQLAEAWAGIGLYHVLRPTEHEQAIDALTRALELNPNLIDASNWLNNVLQHKGDMRGSLELLRNVTARDPLYRPGYVNAVGTFDQFGMTEEAEALIERIRSIEPNELSLIVAETTHRLMLGRAAEGLRFAERAHELAPNDDSTRFALGIALIDTAQVERLAKEGHDFLRVDALDYLGRRDDAFDLAYDQARAGYPQNLFILFNRARRSPDLIAYLEERWPNLGQFNTDYPHDGFGYALMIEVALAYNRSGNEDRFNQALEYVRLAMSDLERQGIDNFIVMMELAKYRALAGDKDAALDAFEQAIAKGWLDYAPSAWTNPVLEAIADEPRFIEGERLIAENVNRERAELGLDPVELPGAIR